VSIFVDNITDVTPIEGMLCAGNMLGTRDGWLCADVLFAWNKPARVFLEDGAPTWPDSFDMCPDWLGRCGGPRRHTPNSQAILAAGLRLYRAGDCRLFRSLARIWQLRFLGLLQHYRHL
jgi:hypothetical protein